MAEETHFIQACEGPVFVGPGPGALLCRCGNVLVEGYDPARFRGVGFACGNCGALTTTPPLPAGEAPPAAVIVAEPVAEARGATTHLPADVFVIGRKEMDRIAALLTPLTPAANVYDFDDAMLARVAAKARSLTGADLPRPARDPGDPFRGIGEHALGWAVAHLRGRMDEGAWATDDRAETSAACTTVAAFLHFVATWERHQLFPAMAGTAAAGGFSLHALSLFAAAHCLAMQGNRVAFPAPGPPIGHALIATGPAGHVAVRLARFDLFEHPYGRAWTPAGLCAAVSDTLAAERGRINLRNPGMLLLSPGIALAGFDEALIGAVRAALPAAGRKNRGLMAAGPVVLRMQRLAEPHAIRFGYGFFPVANRHYQGEALMQPAPVG